MLSPFCEDAIARHAEMRDARSNAEEELDYGRTRVDLLGLLRVLAHSSRKFADTLTLIASSAL